MVGANNTVVTRYLSGKSQLVNRVNYLDQFIFHPVVFSPRQSSYGWRGDRTEMFALAPKQSQVHTSSATKGASLFAWRPSADRTHERPRNFQPTTETQSAPTSAGSRTYRFLAIDPSAETRGWHSGRRVRTGSRPPRRTSDPHAGTKAPNSWCARHRLRCRSVRAAQAGI
jgi:hypothetical protein